MRETTGIDLIMQIISLMACVCACVGGGVLSSAMKANYDWLYCKGICTDGTSDGQILIVVSRQ